MAIIESRESKQTASEKAFQNWLDKNEIPYWYIKQDMETFSPALRKYSVKRPDFLILIPNMGFFLADVKYEKLAEKYPKFFINAEEAEKYANLQKLFNLPTWFVLSSDESHFKTWYWIPIMAVLNEGLLFERKQDKQKCYSVPVDKFVQVADSDSLERVFSQMLKPR
ncbi:MAG TPA: hypothetical protein VI612_03610 [Candidatus Nanoarchaeia archaeon]|nr:hypothetical protein [Candidatus Nanoarchaeia archaeon]